MGPGVEILYIMHLLNFMYMSVTHVAIINIYLLTRNASSLHLFMTSRNSKGKESRSCWAYLISFYPITGRKYNAPHVE